jgi:hypothetical protein
MVAELLSSKDPCFAPTERITTLRKRLTVSLKNPLESKIRTLSFIMPSYQTLIAVR